ncbi:hypothetical protein HF519_29185, partial [Pseudonocardia bannensis]
GGLGALVLAIGKWVLIVLGIAVAAAVTIFVLLPGLAYLVELAIVGALIGWRKLTGRPWTVRAREDRDAPNVREWQVSGWAGTDRVGAEVADALARGVEPRPRDAEPLLPPG